MFNAEHVALVNSEPARVGGSSSGPTVLMFYVTQWPDFSRRGRIYIQKHNTDWLFMHFSGK